MTWAQYGEDLEANLDDLVQRLRSGAYRAHPVRVALVNLLNEVAEVCW